MRKYKHYILMLFGGMLMLPQTTYAFWPVFDFTEIVPIYEDITDGLTTINDLKSQLNIKNLTLDAIGKEMNSFASFGEGTKKSSGSGKKSVKTNVQTIKVNETKTKGATQKTTTAADLTVNTQKNIASDYVDQTQKVIDVQDSEKTSFNIVSEPFQISANTITNNNIFEEEEEEEEQELSAIEEEINMLQTMAVSEQKQLATEFNDILDTQLTILNQSASDNEKALNGLSRTVLQMKKINQDDKEKLQDKIAQIAKRQRDANDWAIRIVESVKENYNKEYNAQIKDGMNNYTKVVIAYIRGDATRESVIAAGEMLKKNINAINVTPDSGVLNELYNKMADIRAEVENLEAEVDGILKNT